VYAYAVNEQRWTPTMPPPYVIASVELDAQPGLRVITNIVDCEPGEVHVGMSVAARFERLGDFFVPLFGPRDEGGEG
jgi:uncharacterized OB-fold protein